MASSQLLNEVKTAMIKYYTMLARMPHFPEDSLLLPPPEGWPDMDVEKLRTLGRSDATIEFVRHLPCLKPCVNSERAWITPTSPAIAFHHGETWPYSSEANLVPPTPPHLFYLTLSYTHYDGTYLCVDTKQGTIVELEGRLKDGISGADAEKLPEDEKWTVYRALPAKEFYDRQAYCLLNLFYMPVPPTYHPNMDRQPTFYQRMHSLAEEEAMRGIEDEWEADHEDDQDYIDNSDESLPDTQVKDLQLESDSEDVDEDDNSIDSAEVKGLLADTEEYERTHVTLAESGDPALKPFRGPFPPLPKENLRVYDIYKRNGWPYEYFNVVLCRAELIDFEQELENEVKKRREEYDRTRPKTKKEWCEDRRQRMKKIFLEQGKPWDEEKERTQSAEEWVAEFMSAQRKESSGK